MLILPADVFALPADPFARAFYARGGSAASTVVRRMANGAHSSISCGQTRPSPFTTDENCVSVSSRSLRPSVPTTASQRIEMGVAEVVRLRTSEVLRLQLRQILGLTDHDRSREGSHADSNRRPQSSRRNWATERCLWKGRSHTTPRLARAWVIALAAHVLANVATQRSMHFP